MKCLVSGATGFVGRHLCRQLLAQGDSVTALSLSGSPLADGTPTVALDLAAADPDAALMQGVDAVFHLAGIAHQRADTDAYRKLNTLATLRLAHLAAAQGVRCFVFVSSVKAMGPADTRDRRSENDCSPPRDAYGRSKWEAECALREEFSGAAMSIVIVRPALVYGPGAKGNLSRLARAVQWGMPRPPEEGAHSMLALQDLADLLCTIAAHPPPGVQTWIACDDRGYSTRYLYDLLRRASGKGRGRAWLPRWAWRLVAALLDLAAGQRGTSTFDKLFGTELYSSAAVSTAMNWRPRVTLDEVVSNLVASGGRGQL